MENLLRNVRITDGIIIVNQNLLKDILVQNSGWNYQVVIDYIQRRYNRQMTEAQVLTVRRRLIRLRGFYTRRGGNPNNGINPVLNGEIVLNAFTNEEGIDDGFNLNDLLEALPEVQPHPNPDAPVRAAADPIPIERDRDNENNDLANEDQQPQNQIVPDAPVPIMPQPNNEREVLDPGIAPIEQLAPNVAAPNAQDPVLHIPNVDVEDIAAPLDAADVGLVEVIDDRNADGNVAVIVADDLNVPPNAEAPPDVLEPPLVPIQWDVILQIGIYIAIFGFLFASSLIGIGLYTGFQSPGENSDNQELNYVSKAASFASSAMLSRQFAVKSGQKYRPVFCWKPRIKFILYRKNIPDGIEIYGKIDDIKKGLDPTEEMKFITHGFFSSGNSTMAKDIRESFLSEWQASVNVVVVCWRDRARPNNFMDFVYIHEFYDRVVDEEMDEVIEAGVAFLTSYFKLKLSKPQNVELVGHSLGAHVCGGVGKGVFELTGNKLKTIYALDPAKPRFIVDPPLKASVGTGDAKKVFVFSSDNFFGGVFPADAVVFLNGGFSQPGCEVLLSLDLGLLNHKCSHSFVNKFFSASINIVFSGCSCEPRFAKHCVSKTDFLMFFYDECPGGCRKVVGVGYSADKKTSGDIYLETGAEPSQGIKSVKEFNLRDGISNHKLLLYSPSGIKNRLKFGSQAEGKSYDKISV